MTTRLLHGTIARRIAPVLISCALIAACTTASRSPADVKDAGRSANALEQRQKRTGEAYRRLEEARYQSKLAEQDWLNANEAYRRTQQAAEELKAQADKAHQAFLAAQKREAQARADYEEGIRSVDELYRAGGASGKRE